MCVCACVCAYVCVYVCIVMVNAVCVYMYTQYYIGIIYGPYKTLRRRVRRTPMYRYIVKTIQTHIYIYL